MRRFLLALPAAAALALLPAAPASAACFGTENTAGVCVSVDSQPIYSDCVYVGSPPCHPVTVYGYDVDCGGWIRDAYFICTF